jgi:hypothetical protein
MLISKSLFGAAEGARNLNADAVRPDTIYYGRHF